jgi:nitroimidazol reductase NimA-like FMN-containing flavoprotein (pyridoxamine 5'-phosphate oxidase superfamily)
MDESLGLLGSIPYGRLAYVDAGVPAIVPVNHGVDPDPRRPR